MNKDVVYSFLSIGLVSIAGILTTSFLSRNLTEDNFGHFSTIFLVLSMTMLLDGFKPIVIFNVSKNNFNNVKFLLLLTLCFSIFGGFLGFFYIDYISETFYFSDVCLMVLSISTNVLVSFFWGVLEGQGKVGISRFIRALIYSMMYLSMAISAYLSSEIKYFSLIVFFYLVVLLILFIHKANVFKEISFKNKLDKQIITALLKKSKENLFFNIIVSLMYILDRSILSRLSGVQALAVYSSQYEFATRVNLFSGTLSNVLFPHLAKSRVGLNSYEIWKSITLSSIIILFFIIGILSIYSELIIGLYLGDKYVAWHRLLKILLIGLYMNSFGFFSIALMRSMNNFKTYVHYYFYSLLAAIILVYPLIKAYDIYGAALTYLIIRIADLLIFVKSLRINKRNYFILLWVMLIPITLLSLSFFYNNGYLIISTCIYLIFSMYIFKKEFFVFKSFILGK